MKIAIYGGSFNPIHKGHVKVAQIAIKKLNLDKLFFVPTFKNPFRINEKYVDGTHRINMINLVKEAKMETSSFEVNQKGPSFTIKTIKYFKNKFPNDELFLIIGSDQIFKLNKWKNIQEIASLSQIIIFKRKKNFQNINVKKFGCKILNNPIFNYSSTEFKKGDFDQIDPKVNKYIAKNFLYVNEILFNMVDAKRFKHSIATGILAIKYAKQLNYDLKKAWFAGTTHDITKSKSEAWHRGFLASLGQKGFETPKHTLHSLSGYHWLKEKYKIEDEQILNAVKNHTNLAENLSVLDKIIYAADKLSQGRKFIGIQAIREIITKDFEKGFKMIVQRNYSKLCLEKKNISSQQIKIYEKLTR